MTEPRRLRVLIASNESSRLPVMADAVSDLGHDVVARIGGADEVGARSIEAAPDVALVGIGEQEAPGLALIDRVIADARCGVVAVVDGVPERAAAAAARRGVYGVLLDHEPQEWRRALEVASSRYAELRDLSAAFDRRSTIECAKGILMERHGLDQDAAFGMLRDQARSTNRKLVLVAASLIESHTLMRERTAEPHG